MIRQILHNENQENKANFVALSEQQEYGWWFYFLTLCLIECITFGINAKKVGVYQDEWISFSQLHFVPHSLLQLISTCFWNPRLIVRPLEALHYGPLFYFVHENPLWYHIICYIAELLGAWFLFLAIKRFPVSSNTAFMSALLYLLYPIHDVTHYEIVASSLPISMAFFTCSLWLYEKALDQGKYLYLLLSAATYFFSIYNYELCLPLVLLYPLLYFKNRASTGQQVRNAKEVLKAFLHYQIPIFLVFFSMILYRRFLLPSLNLGWNYATVFDPSNFFSVLWSGWLVSFSPFTVEFCFKMLVDALKEGFSPFYYLALAAGSASIFALFYFSVPTSSKVQGQKKNQLFWLIAFGAITILLSYTIYGLSPEHKPVIDAWLNRVNLGGALGASLIIAGCFGLLEAFFTTSSHRLLLSTFVTVFAAALILVNWQFAKPWITSWNTQKELISFIKMHSSEIKSGDSIIIGHILRYASKWTPVVDGVWDFQGIVRTTLNNWNVNGTVLTERLQIENDALVDKYNNILLGRFPFKHMFILDPLKRCWTKISSREEFLDIAKELDWNVAISH